MRATLAPIETLEALETLETLETERVAELPQAAGNITFTLDAQAIFAHGGLSSSKSGR